MDFLGGRQGTGERGRASKVGRKQGGGRAWGRLNISKIKIKYIYITIMRRWESLPGRAGGQGGRGARHVQVSGVALNTFSLKTINTVDLARTREGCKRGSVQASVHESGPHPRGNQVCTFML